ncbi:hypothetical protein CC80DRAFT_491560 [Byssothecium circinans]|uniref:Uncharacterized protein n=1 Tax=Byssothecium circinans TaxID=147558 RepID=A0A6A5TX42_9PLEO|nr:hypothetical protein CC80DRAFT_491560 [Byssothecium circinans]
MPHALHILEAVKQATPTIDPSDHPQQPACQPNIGPRKPPNAFPSVGIPNERRTPPNHPIPSLPRFGWLLSYDRCPP